MLKESFSLESWIASCAVVNTSPSQLEQCGYYSEALGFTVFGNGWPTCEMSDEVTGMMYCYHEGANNLFSS